MAEEVALALALRPQVLDQRLGVHLLLKIDRRRLDDEVGPVGYVLAAPDELRVQVRVTPLELRTNRLAFLRRKHGLKLGRRDACARVVMREGLNGGGGSCRIARHQAPSTTNSVSASL